MEAATRVDAAQAAALADEGAPVVSPLRHPLGFRLLLHFLAGTASPRAASREFAAPLATVSYHVRKLAAAGLIREVDRIARRGAIEHVYAHTPAGRALAEGLIGLLDEVNRLRTGDPVVAE